MGGCVATNLWRAWSVWLSSTWESLGNRVSAIWRCRPLTLLPACSESEWHLMTWRSSKVAQEAVESASHWSRYNRWDPSRSLEPQDGAIVDDFGTKCTIKHYRAFTPLVPFNALGAKFFFLLAILEAIWYKNMLPLNCPNDIERLQRGEKSPYITKISWISHFEYIYRSTISRTT